MNVGQCSQRTAHAISMSADVVDAAMLMREHHVGFLVVFQDSDPLRKPVGVITDRDLVLEVMPRDTDPHSVTVGDVMTREPLTAKEGDDLSDLAQAMRFSGIRRVPVVDARGALSGVIALDDLVAVISSLLNELAGSIKSEQRQEWRSRPT